MDGPNVAIMLGRKGSKGFPGKNLIPILGRPMMMYPLLAASNSRYVEQTFVTTDDPEIMELSAREGANVIERPPELCTDEALFEDALVHAYHETKRRIGVMPGYVIILMCNAPTITSDMVDSGIDMLESQPEADSAVSVSSFNMWSPLRARKLSEDGLLNPFVPFETFGDPATLSCDRDSQGDVYYADMGVSVSRARALEDIDNGLLPQKWMGKKILPIDNWAGMDIDYGWQIPIAEYWLKEHGFTESINPPPDRATTSN